VEIIEELIMKELVEENRGAKYNSKNART